MQRKAKTKMGEIHHRYVWYDINSKQSGGGQTSVSQRHLGSDDLTTIYSARGREIERARKRERERERERERGGRPI